VTGNYALAPKIHTTFNYSYTHATQNESFAGMGLSTAAGLPTSLNGVMDTTVAQAGISARPWTKLSMLANVRFEDNADGTPKALYGGTYVNPNNSSQKVNSKAEVSYLFPEGSRGTVGVDYNWIKRNVPNVGSSDLVISSGSLTSIREQTNELSYRAELRKPLTDNLNASVAFVQSFRNGTHWINLGSTSAQYPNTYQTMRYADVYAVTGIFPSTMMDRKREKVRGTIDWNASEKLSMQFSLENGQDTFSAPTTTGLHSSGMTSAAVDASYAVNDNWKTTGYLSYGEQTLNESHSAGYIARIVNTTSTAGVGVVGKVNGKLEVGADLSYLTDINGYGFESGSSAAPGSLPDVSYRMLALKLYGKYALSARSEVRVDLVQQNINYDDWAWTGSGVPYTFSDNSTVAMQSSQSVTYIGVKYVYRLK